VCGQKTEIRLGWRLNFFGSEDAAATPVESNKTTNFYPLTAYPLWKYACILLKYARIFKHFTFNIKSDVNTTKHIMWVSIS
jgi:hypothetical protein